MTKPKFKPALRTETETTLTIRIDNNDLIAMFNYTGIKIPDNADIYVKVPGGGDWSNTQLDIGSHSQIFVKWTETDVTET